MTDQTAKVNEAMASIVETVIDAMENGCAPWQKRWDSRSTANWPSNLLTGHKYQGGNALYLAILGAVRGCDYWVGFKQAKQLGGNVRKGEKGTAILRPIRIKIDKGTPDERYITKGFALTYVWNVLQCDGIELPTIEAPELRELDVSMLDDFVTATGANVIHGGDRACFIPSLDQVHMPEPGQFHDAGAYYGTLLHELVHWTGHASRLDRSKAKSRHGYAFEELVAELGAYYASERLSCPNEAENHTSYLAGWVKELRNDPNYLWKAAALAEKASHYLIEAGGQAEKLAA